MGTKAAVEHYCYLTLAEMDIDHCGAHTVDLFYSGGELVELVDIQGMTKANTVIGLVWSEILDAGGGSF